MKPIHDQFLIAVDESEPVVRLLADMRAAGFEVDYMTDPPTLRRAKSNVAPIPVRMPERQGDGKGAA